MVSTIGQGHPMVIILINIAQLGFLMIQAKMTTRSGDFVCFFFYKYGNGDNLSHVTLTIYLI